MKDVLKDLKEILNSRPTLIGYSILLLIIFLLLILKGTPPFTTLGIIILLIFVTILPTCFLLKCYKEQKAIDLEEKRIDLETTKVSAEKEKEVRKEERLKILEKYDPHLPKFFRVLERKNTKTYLAIENKLLESKKKAFFIIESGERPPENRKKTFFSQYIENVLSKSPKYRIFRIKIFGTSSFILILKSNEQIDITKINEEYYKFIQEEVEKQKNENLKEWFKKFNLEKKQLLLISQPYVSSLLNLIDKFSKRMSKDGLKELYSEINEILKEEIKICEIKFSYLLEAVEFEEKTISEFEQLEDKIIKELKDRYQLKNSKNIFSELLSKKDFLQNFELELERFAPEFLKRLKNDSRYDELKNLIESIQTKIYGVNL
jgi:hypothetical protein